MVRLRQRDVTAFSQALATLYAETSAETLSKRVLACVRGLFDCDFATFAMIDLRHGLWHASSLAPMVSDWPGVAAMQRHVHEDPAAVYIMRTRDPSAVKMSDFVSLRQYRATGIYSQVFRRVGCDRRLGLAVHNEAPVTLVTTLNRKGRDFSEGDRAMLNLLRPHLLQANNQSYASRLATEEREREHAGLGDVFGMGLGEIDATGRMLWITPRGQTLLREFFPGTRQALSPAHLPDELHQMFAPTLRPWSMAALTEPPGPKRLVWRFAGPEQRQLQTRLNPGATRDRWLLTLEETQAAAPALALAQVLKLTRRQAEVLHWLKQGKTNWEIATVLGIAERTVGKHLEDIFTRLGVENRTAAARIAVEASLAR